MSLVDIQRVGESAPSFEAIGYPRQLQTVEAIREIAGLSRAERKNFEATEDPYEQENLIKQRWIANKQIELQSGHDAARALQRVEYALEHVDDADNTFKVERYFVLCNQGVDEDKITDDVKTWSYHWQVEGKFRAGLGRLLSQCLETDFNLSQRAPNQPPESYLDTQIECRVGDSLIVVSNQLQRYPEEIDEAEVRANYGEKGLENQRNSAGMPFGSLYIVEQLRA